MKLRGEVEYGQRGDLSLREDGTMVMGQRLRVPDVGDVRREIMEEAHSSAYAMHPGSTKMYHTLKQHYWWKGMKRDIAEFVSRCVTPFLKHISFKSFQICRSIFIHYGRPINI